MNTRRRKLPLGIATFSEIINEGKYYFLSRPRRRRYSKACKSKISGIGHAATPLFPSALPTAHWSTHEVQISLNSSLLSVYAWIADYEGYSASVFYSYFAALGYDCRVEDATQLGRIDLTLKLPQHIYLFEFKVVESQPNGAALAQLQTKAYADKYRALGLPIELIGVEFSRNTRNVVGFEHALA